MKGDAHVHCAEIRSHEEGMHCNGPSISHTSSFSSATFRPRFNSHVILFPVNSEIASREIECGDRRYTHHYFRQTMSCRHPIIAEDSTGWRACEHSDEYRDDIYWVVFYAAEEDGSAGVCCAPQQFLRAADG